MSLPELEEQNKPRRAKRSLGPLELQEPEILESLKQFMGKYL